jgi:hypothetical protein
MKTNFLFNGRGSAACLRRAGARRRFARVSLRGRYLRIGVAAGVLLVSGCASSLSKNQCRAGDWQTIGYRDGANGYASTRLLEHQDACVKLGVLPDRDRYMRGWQEGVTTFCTAENGFSQGENGAGYGRICPSDLEPEFLSAYKDGRSLYLAGAEVDRLAGLLDSKSGELVSVNERLVTVVSRVALDSGASPAERVALVNESTTLAHTRGRLEGEIESIGVELAVQRQRYSALQQELAYRH